jgi:two-component system NtrC family sensor kinase
MVIDIAVPIFDVQGEQIGVLEGGQLLNRNLDFVDTINDLVYNDGALPLGSRGTATRFLDDVRIATNVRMFGGDRALGTRVSAAVRHRVLDNGERWLDRAFVVNDWYVSGYEPVVDGDDRRIGMLYVGFLEAPFREVKQNILAALIGLFALIMATGVVLWLRGARSIFRPIERMDATIGAVEKGDASARTGAVEGGEGGEEIARLASHLDTLLDTVAAREAELKQLNAELDQKVVERTAELREAQRQLVRSEKLAAIGQLTAGVAHEINNPIAVMQGNLDLMRALLGPAGNTVKTEVRLLDEQINRIRVIVTKLLQYARPGEFAGYVDELDTATLLHDTLPLVQHQARKSGVDIVFDTEATTRVRINRDELQQVLVNLVVNALHAMPDGGTLATRDSEDPPGARIDVRDTGHGIAPEHIGRVFDPFFTTKRLEGTGLGLVGVTRSDRALWRHHHGQQHAGRGHLLQCASAGRASVPRRRGAGARVRVAPRRGRLRCRLQSRASLLPQKPGSARGSGVCSWERPLVAMRRSRAAGFDRGRHREQARPQKPGSARGSGVCSWERPLVAMRRSRAAGFGTCRNRDQRSLPQNLRSSRRPVSCRCLSARWKSRP